MDKWGNLSNLWIPCVYHLDQGIPVEYELDTFNTPPQEELYVTPKIGYVDAMPLFRSRHLALNSPLGHLNGDNARLSTRRKKLTVTPKFISSNGNMAFAKLRWTHMQQKAFWFGAQFNSTHNFTQSGWPILFKPNLFPGQQKLGEIIRRIKLRAKPKCLLVQVWI